MPLRKWIVKVYLKASSKSNLISSFFRKAASLHALGEDSKELFLLILWKGVYDDDKY